MIKFFLFLVAVCIVLSCPVLSGLVPPQTRYFSRGFPSEERKKVKEFKDWGIGPVVCWANHEENLSINKKSLTAICYWLERGLFAEIILPLDDGDYVVWWLSETNDICEWSQHLEPAQHWLSWWIIILSRAQWGCKDSAIGLQSLISNLIGMTTEDWREVEK